MRARLIAAAAGVCLLTACTPEETPEEALFGMCSDVMSEAGERSQMCACYSQMVASEDSDVVDLHLQVMDGVYMARLNDGAVAQEAINLVADRLAEDASRYSFSVDALRSVESYVAGIPGVLETNPLCGNPPE
jgi:hypothetical protein